MHEKESKVPEVPLVSAWVVCSGASKIKHFL